MITTAIYFDIVWFGFTGVDLQPQVMSPRVFSSRLKEVVHKGFLPRVLLLSQLHFTCKRRWLIFHKAIRTASIICLRHFVVRHFFSGVAFTTFHVTFMTNLVYELGKNVRSLARPFSTLLVLDGFIISSLTTTSWIFVCLRSYDAVIGLGGASAFLL